MKKWDTQTELHSIKYLINNLQKCKGLEAQGKTKKKKNSHTKNEKDN